MHPQSNDIPEHRHPEIERDIARRFALLHEFMAQGFADILRELEAGFTRVNQRLERVESRLDAIEAHLRRITPNGQNP